MTDSTHNNTRVSQDFDSSSEAQSNQYEEGQRAEGVVTFITKSKAFLSIGPFSAKLNKSMITWDSTDATPEEYLYVGQKLDVKIIKIDHVRMKMKVSLRDLQEKPAINSDLTAGMIIDGVVQKKLHNGFIVAIPEVGNGFLHKNELDWRLYEQSQRFKSIQVGDSIRALVSFVDHEKRLIYLSLKRQEENPINTFELEHAIGSSVEVRVIHYGKRGVLVRHPSIGDIWALYSENWDISLEDMKKLYPKYSKISVRVKPGNENRPFSLEPEFMPF